MLFEREKRLRYLEKFVALQRDTYRLLKYIYIPWIYPFYKEKLPGSVADEQNP